MALTILTTTSSLLSSLLLVLSLYIAYVIFLRRHRLRHFCQAAVSIKISNLLFVSIVFICLVLYLKTYYFIKRFNIVLSCLIK